MANFNIRVTVDPRPAIAGTKKVERRLQSLGRTAAGVRGQFLSLLGAGGVALALAGITRVMANFEQTMSTVKGITGATEAQFQTLTDTARELGATTRFTASQAGEGLVALSRAGFSVDKSLTAVKDTLLLAQAGALGLGEAAQITAGVLQGFRLEVGQVTRVTDVMALAANSSATDVSQLGQALSFVAPVAAGLGVSLEETTAAVGALSNANLRGTRAGTGLRRVLAELESPGNVALEIFDRLSVKAEEVKVSQVGLTAALQRLKSAGLDATTGALEIFGQRGGPAFEVLASSIPTIIKMEEELRNAAGTTQKMADIMDDNLNGALLRVKSAAEAIVLSFGEIGGSGFLRGFFEGLASVLRKVAKEMDNLLRLFQALIITMVVSFAKKAVPLAVAGFRLIIAQVVRLTAVIAANPLGALAVALIAIGSLLFAFRDKIKLSSEGAATFGDLLAETAEIIKKGLAGAVVFANDVLGEFGRAINIVFGDLDFSIAGAIRALARFADFLGSALATPFRIVFTIVTKLPSALKDAFITGLNAILPAVEGITNKVITLLNKIPGVEIGLVDIPKIKNTAEGAGKAFGKEMLANITSELVVPGAATKLANDLLAGAEERARQRLRDAAGQQDEGGGVPSGAEEPEPTGADQASRIQTVIQQLQVQQELLTQNNATRMISNELLQIEADLGDKLTESELALVVANLELVQSLQKQAEVLDEIRGPQEELLLRQEALAGLLRSGKIEIDEYNDAVSTLALRSAEADNSVRGGLSAGLLQITDRLKDVGRNVQQFVTGAFDKATDAIANFATTGKFEFRAFVSDLLKQLAKLALQLALTAALKAALESTGGFGGLISGFSKATPAVPGAQNGLDGVIGGSGGTDSQLVAFRGTPGERVQVTTPGQQGNANSPIVVQAPPVNITNVQSADDIPLGIESAEGEQAVLNVLSRNIEAIKAMTG